MQGCVIIYIIMATRTETKEGADIISFSHVAPSVNFPICREAADKLTLRGVGNFRVIKAENQVNPDTGQPLRDGQLNVIYIGQPDRRPLAGIVAKAIEIKQEAVREGRPVETDAIVLDAIKASSKKLQRKAAA